jgi:hypothetical protein
MLPVRPSITIEASPAGVERIVVTTGPGQRPAGIQWLERLLPSIRALDEDLHAPGGPELNANEHMP